MSTTPRSHKKLLPRPKPILSSAMHGFSQLRLAALAAC